MEEKFNALISFKNGLQFEFGDKKPFSKLKKLFNNKELLYMLDGAEIYGDEDWITIDKAQKLGLYSKDDETSKIEFFGSVLNDLNAIEEILSYKVGQLIYHIKYHVRVRVFHNYVGNKYPSFDEKQRMFNQMIFYSKENRNIEKMEKVFKEADDAALVKYLIVYSYGYNLFNQALFPKKIHLSNELHEALVDEMEERGLYVIDDLELMPS